MKFENDSLTVNCSCCGRVKVVTAKVKSDQIRLDHILTFIIASIRTQGYDKGYLCRKCQKIKGIDTRYIRKQCKKHLTPELFKARYAGK